MEPEPSTEDAAREAVNRAIATGGERLLLEAAEILLQTLNDDPAFQRVLAELSEAELELIATHLPTGIAARLREALEP